MNDISEFDLFFSLLYTFATIYNIHNIVETSYTLNPNEILYSLLLDWLLLALLFERHAVPIQLIYMAYKRYKY